jgi:ferredoxin
MPATIGALADHGVRPVTHVITLLGVDITFACGEQSTVLRALATVYQAGSIVSGCHGGGCGVCRVRVAQGHYECSAMSRAHVTPADEAEGITLACRTWPRSDLVIEAIGRRRPARSAPPTSKGVTEWES